MTSLSLATAVLILVVITACDASLTFSVAEGLSLEYRHHSSQGTIIRRSLQLSQVGFHELPFELE